MHEASIVQEIINITEEKARENNATKVIEVEISVGAASMIETELLEEAFEVMKVETMLNDAKLKVCKVNLRLHCLNCNKVSESDSIISMQCPYCKSYETVIESGREMYITKIVAE